MNAFIFGLFAIGAVISMVDAELQPLDDDIEGDVDYQVQGDVVHVPNDAWCFDPEQGVYVKCPRRRRFRSRKQGLDVGGRFMRS